MVSALPACARSAFLGDKRDDRPTLIAELEAMLRDVESKVGRRVGSSAT